MVCHVSLMIQTSISRVAPNWHLWRRLFQLSYSTAANFTTSLFLAFLGGFELLTSCFQLFSSLLKKIVERKIRRKAFHRFFSNNLSLAAFVRWKSFSNGRSISDHSERKKVFILLNIKISNNFSKKDLHSGLYLLSLFRQISESPSAEMA